MFRGIFFLWVFWIFPLFSNVTTPSYIKDGLNLSNKTFLGFEVGAFQNCIWDKSFKSMQNFSMYQAAPSLHILLQKRGEIVFSAGSSQCCFEQNNGVLIHYESRSSFLWELEGKVILSQKKWYALGAGAGFLKTEPKLILKTVDGVATNLLSSASRYTQAKISVGLCLYFDYFFPFFDLYYSPTSFTFEARKVKGSQDYGVAIGAVGSTREDFFISAELRLIDELSSKVSLVIRF